MSEKENTPEPIGYGEDNDGWYLSRGDEQIAHGLTEEHARRIVACVNACEGVHTEVLEDAPGYKAAIDDKMRAIETQVHMLEIYREAADAAKRVQVERDQLLAELDCAKNAIVQSINPGSDLIVIKSDGVSKEEAKSIVDWMRRSVTGLSGVIFMPRDSDLSTLSDDELRAAGFVRVRMVLTMENRIAGLIKQRDELLSAIDRIGMTGLDARQMADDAIARVKGGAV